MLIQLLKGLFYSFNSLSLRAGNKSLTRFFRVGQRTDDLSLSDQTVAHVQVGLV